MQSTDAPSHAAYSHFRCEKATITDVDREKYTVKAETEHSSKPIEDIQVAAPYHHYDNGEGIHHLPEVGAQCYVAWPSDNTAPFILCYLGAPGVQTSTDGTPERSTPDGAGSPTDVSYRSKRPKLNPGDIAFTTRDENFIYLRRGGVVQIGATSIAQRIYIPILNYIKDFAENYEMHTFGGDIAWTVARVENDPAGDAPATYVFHLNEFAQDEKATVRIRHLPAAGPGEDSKAAWEVQVSPQGIDKETGEVSDPVYTLLITTSGEKTELVKADRTTTVEGKDTLNVHGDREVTVNGKAKLSAQGDIEEIAGGNAVFGANGTTKVGGADATSPNVLGDQLLAWFASAQWTVAGAVATVSPASITALQQILSRSVFTK